MSNDWKPIWSQAMEWHAKGLKVGLATVVETWGSSPRPVGSHLILNSEGLMEGSVSGGCVEGAVISALEGLMNGGNPEVLDFSVTSEQAWKVGLSCGGRIRVLVESFEQKLPLAEAVLGATEERVLITDISTGVTELNVNTERGIASSLVDQDGALKFFQILSQPLELLIIGAVHISQAMVRIAKTMNLEPIVVDPRGAFSQPERFEGVTLVDEWPDDFLSGRHLTSGTAIVTLTHDPKLDDAALAVALKSPAFYIASLGSRKTHASRIDRLKSRGFDDTDLKRIYGPAGLNIGAKTPAEIAISVLSQMVSVYRNGESL
ncbi:MAG: XdhC family protein [Kordiimonas sp.]